MVEALKPSVTCFQILDTALRKGACALLDSRGKHNVHLEAQAEKGEPFRANMQAVNFRDREQPRTDWRRQVLRLICAQGRVVRREARTPIMLPEFDGVESEADLFNQLLVGHHHGVQCSGAFRALSSE